MKLSTWIRNSGSAKVSRLAYAVGHPAYQELVKMTLLTKLKAEPHEIFCFTKDPDALSQLLMSETGHRQIIFVWDNPDEATYQFIRHGWDSRIYPDTYVVFFVRQPHQKTTELLKTASRGVYVDCEAGSIKDTEALCKLLLPNPSVRFIEYLVSKTGTHPISVTQTLKRLSVYGGLSQADVEQCLYLANTKSFADAVVERKFDLAWSLVKNRDTLEIQKYLRQLTQRVMNMSYVRREQPRLTWEAESQRHKSYAAVSQAYDDLPSYPEEAQQEAIAAVTQAYKHMPEHADRAIVSLLATWPK